ncbi:hypothetical protein ACT2E5_24925 [Burkholderia vietnamiensis]|uniref:hypothetical protein n=1 Tax=Burkholderia vietnamiensis TaxID=60552 RepID=UPI0012D8EB19|nr:hypothetical protein [Burkholderia vietnamiensis]MBR8148527.1 hypothetical protein [Burkholderia vietnamiensis]MBR8218986.1 hypothetical protein [Burkholderia vietnamiensis]HDV8348884.1 hypothetical protein [Burkholderia vietnamiensis]
MDNFFGDFQSFGVGMDLLKKRLSKRIGANYLPLFNRRDADGSGPDVRILTMMHIVSDT